MYKSNKFKYYYFKFISIYAVIMAVYVAFQMSIEKHTVPVNGVQKVIPLNENIWLYLIIIVVFAILGLSLFKNLRLATIDNNKIELKSYKTNVSRTWVEVEKIKLSRAFPPFYSLKFKGDNTIHWFLTKGFTLTFGLKVWDFSKMGALIKRKKLELEI